MLISMRNERWTYFTKFENELFDGESLEKLVDDSRFLTLFLDSIERSMN